MGTNETQIREEKNDRLDHLSLLLNFWFLRSLCFTYLGIGFIITQNFSAMVP